MSEDTPPPGHNSTVTNAQKRAFVDRFIRLDDEKKAFEEDIKGLVKEAKGAGFDSKEFRALVKLSRAGKEKAEAERDAFDARLAVLGWLG